MDILVDCEISGSHGGEYEDGPDNGGSKNL
jgi:hypothetical protein